MGMGNNRGPHFTHRTVNTVKIVDIMHREVVGGRVKAAMSWLSQELSGSKVITGIKLKRAGAEIGFSE
jgi:hypothetical protein